MGCVYVLSYRGYFISTIKKLLKKKNFIIASVKVMTDCLL